MGVCKPSGMTPPFLGPPPDLDLLARDPDTALALLADHLDLVHRAMSPADLLELDVTPTGGGVTECLPLGRHEVPGLALLFRRFRAAPEAEDEVLARATAYVRGSRIVAGS